MSKQISRREAYRLKQENRRLHVELDKVKEIVREQRRYWRNNTSAGMEIYHLDSPQLTSVWAVQTARKLGHAVVVENYGNGLKLFALPLPQEPIA